MTQDPAAGRRDAAADRGLGQFRATAGGGQPFDRPTRTPRLLLLRDQDEESGLDGAWWPRTDNLTTELHNLVTALTTRLGATTCITFDWNSLSQSQRRIDPPDGIDVAGALPNQPPEVMYVYGPGDERLQLLVIAPSTSPAQAEAMIRKIASATADQPKS